MKLVWIEIQNHNMNMHTCKVCKWYWPRKHNQGSHSETPGHGAGKSWQELYEILQGELWSPPPRKEEPLATIDWRLSSWREDLHKGPGSPRQQPADCKSAMHLGKKKKPPELYEWEHSQLMEELTFLLSSVHFRQCVEYRV